MDLAWTSVAALAVTVVVSCTTRVNPGVLAIAFAWLIAAFVAPHSNPSITVKAVLSGFPSDLFLTLTGVTLLFAQAQVNGTLDRVAQAAVRCCRGNAGTIPLAFFGLAAVISAIGAGSVATAAVVAPMAMAAAANARIPAFLMAIMVGHGAVAGGMSPFAMTGVIANGLMGRMGLPNYAWQTFGYNFAANALVALSGYLVFGGWRLFGKSGESDEPVLSEGGGREVQSADGVTRNHWLTLAVVAALIVAVLGFKIHVGLAAFAGAALLTLVGAADEKQSFGAVPWAVIVMVCGVTVLTSLLERTGGIERITDVIAGIATPRTLPGIMAFATGLISVYSSTSGVVLPAFLPAVPGLIAKLGGGSAIAIASSINIGGNLVDVSPLSTIGALCIACASATEDRRVLFHQVLAWGLSMALVGALFCTALFSWSQLAR